MYYFILFLLLIVIAFIFTRQERFQPEKLYNGTNWDSYRLADIILYPDYLSTSCSFTTLHSMYKYPDTIGVKYAKRKFPFLNKIQSKEDASIFKNSEEDKYLENNGKSIQLDLNLLKSIIEEQCGNNTVHSHKTLLLHMRVGDVICSYPEDYTTRYAKKGNKDWWNSVVEYIHRNNIDTVIILAGTHKKECVEQSAEYIKDRVTFLKEQTGVNISYRLGNSPDEDLCYVINAKHFISTGGGYGYFLGSIVQMNGGNFVLNDDTSKLNDRVLF